MTRRVMASTELWEGNMKYEKSTEKDVNANMRKSHLICSRLREIFTMDCLTAR